MLVALIVAALLSALAPAAAHDWRYGNGEAIAEPPLRPVR
jgi:post-segregation antitoxin (ccd killing protein)